MFILFIISSRTTYWIKLVEQLLCLCISICGKQYRMAIIFFRQLKYKKTIKMCQNTRNSLSSNTYVYVCTFFEAYTPIKSLLVATLSCIGQSRNFLNMTVQNFESVTVWGDLSVPIEVSQQRYLGCLAIGMWMNKISILLFGGNQFVALSMD